MENKIFAICIMTCLLCFGGCSSMPQGSSKSSKEFERFYNSCVKSGEFEDCINLLVKKNSNYKQLNYTLDEGFARHFIKDYDNSEEILYSADMKMQEIIRGKDYIPSLFEAYQVVSYDALNHYNQGDVESAMTRIRRMAEIQQMYADHRAIVEAAQAEAENPSSEKHKSLVTSSLVFGINFEKIKENTPEKGKLYDYYVDSSFARYVSALIRLSYGDKDYEVDINNLKKLAPQVPDFYIEEGKGSFNVLALSGTIAQRVEGMNEFPGNGIMTGEKLSILLPICDENGNIVDSIPVRFRFSYPKYERQSQLVDSVKFSVNDEFYETVLLEDFDEAVRKDCDYNARTAYNNNVAAVIAAKSAAALGGTAAVSAAYITARHLADSGVPPVLAMATYDIAKAALVKSIDEIDAQPALRADLRQVRILPSAARVGKAMLDEGEYTVKIQYFSGENPVKEEIFNNVKVVAGKPVLVESLCTE